MPIVPLVADCSHLNLIGARDGGEAAGFAAMAAAGLRGVILKGRQGIGFADPAFARRRDLARAAGLLVGAYDFATHDVVADNVKDFLATTNAVADTALGLYLDFEDNRASQMSGDQAYEFLDRTMQATGRACGLYGGNRIREQIDAQHPNWIDMAKVAPLWQCRYLLVAVDDVPTLFKRVAPIPPWTKNFLIQYTGDGVGPGPHTAPGLQNGADLNAFNGTPDALAAQWAGAPVTFAAA